MLHPLNSYVLKPAVIGLALAATMMPLGAMATSTNTSTTACTVKIVGTQNTSNQANSRFAVSGQTITGKFIVSGNEDCKVDVTLATWQAPDAGKGQPYSAQKLFKFATGKFGPGEHSLSTQLPECFFQADLVRGTNPTAADGSPVYESGRMLGSLHGGTKACITPETPPTGGEGGGSLTPEVPATPAATPTPTLPDTGAGLSTFLGLLALTGTGYAYLRSRRSVQA
jgi:hypothetical protein